MCGLLLHNGFIAPTLIVLLGLHIANPTLKADLNSFARDRGAVLLTWVFLVCLISGLWSEDVRDWIDRSRVKLPFLVLPIMLMSLRSLPKSWLLLSLKVFVAVAFLSAVGVMIHYVIHLDAVNETISRGKHIPTPVNHIRYSLLMALAALSGFYLFDQSSAKAEGLAFLPMALLLAIFLHVLAVRSGLVGFYVAMLFIVLHALTVRRKWLLGVALIALMTVTPIIAYHSVDSFRNRVAYMRHEIEVFFSGRTPAGYSDIKRVVSMQAGMAVARQSPLIGVGMGDLRAELNKEYGERGLSIYHDTLPHNQFIVFLAGTGAVGLLLSATGMVAVLFSVNRRKSWVFVAVTLVLMTSCLFEATLETQLGVAIYAFFSAFWIAFLGKPSQA
jgi:O-antigen ligase